MGIKRIVDVQFWNDDKVLEFFSPEDKLFMLYLMTNPHTTQLGIYPINKKHMSFELGYTIDVINVLIDRFENKYHMIQYSNTTKEVAIKNYLKHSIIKGGAPVRDCLIKELRQVKNKNLIEYIFRNIKGDELLNETVKKLIEEYELKNGEILYSNDNNNDNDNDNEVSYHDTSNVSLNKKQLEKEFIEVWNEYPKKQGKPNALKSYIKARKNGIEKDFIINAIKKYKSYVDSIDWLNYKNGSTWFNQECWNDEYDLKDIKNNTSKQPTRKEVVPEWFNKEYEEKPLTEEDKATFEKEVAELQEMLKNKY